MLVSNQGLTLGAAALAVKMVQNVGSKFKSIDRTAAFLTDSPLANHQIHVVQSLFRDYVANSFTGTI